MIKYNTKIEINNNEIKIRKYNGSYFRNNHSKRSNNVKKFSEMQAKSKVIDNEYINQIKQDIKKLKLDYKNAKLCGNQKELNKILFEIDKKRVLINSIKMNKDEKGSSSTITYRSLSRTRKNLFDTIKNNAYRFKSFITLTFEDNIDDFDTAIYVFKKYISSIRKELKQSNIPLYYICVPEFQKRGAIHFHMLTNISVGSSVIPRQPKKKRVKSKKTNKTKYLEYYDLKYWIYGFSSAEAIENNDSNALSYYLGKYLSKDIDSNFFGRQKVLKSTNLDKPRTFLIDSEQINEDVLSLINNESNTKMSCCYSYNEKGVHNDIVPQFDEYHFDINSKVCNELLDKFSKISSR